MPIGRASREDEGFRSKEAEAKATLNNIATTLCVRTMRKAERSQTAGAVAFRRPRPAAGPSAAVVRSESHRRRCVDRTLLATVCHRFTVSPSPRTHTTLRSGRGHKAAKQRYGDGP